MSAEMRGIELPAVMGIVNVTPDSFSDGGRFLDPQAAIAHGLRLREEGADIVDVGGESTRPGAEPVDAAEELDRVLPVVTALAERGIRVSIDTRHAEVAEAAVAAGLGLRLGGENRYGDRVEIRPPLGTGRPAERDDIGRAVALSGDVCALLVVIPAISARITTRNARR